MSSAVVRRRNMLKRNAMRFVAALLVALAGFVSIPNVALYERRRKNRPQNAAGAALCGGVKVVHRGILVS